MIAPFRDDHPEPVEDKRQLSPVVFVIILAVVLCIAVGVITSSFKRPDRADAIGAYVACKQFIEGGLKAPSTAVFASQSQSDITNTGDGSFRVNSYVDAQNSFGAMIRTDFTCTVKYEGGDQWGLVDLQTNP